jgi:hypothetical protein
VNRERRQQKGDAEVRRTEKEGEGRTRDKKEGMQIADCRRRQEEDRRREMQTGERKKEKMVQTGEGERRKKRE